MACRSHPAGTTLCSCGYARQTPDPTLPLPWPRARLSEVWKGLSERQREVWRYWLELAKPFETQPDAAATLAATKAAAA